MSLANLPQKLVTIAIPTFNRAYLLKGCILSALSQTYPHFEVLVSDNASTDNTAEMLREFRDPRLRVLRQHCNVGAIPNWNNCLTEAKGEYIVFVPDDDTVAPWLLERCMALIEHEPRITIVLTLTAIHQPGWAEWLPSTPARLKTGTWTGVDLLGEFLRGNIGAVMCGTLIRTDALRTVGGFPIDFPFAADTAALVPLFFQGSAGFVNEVCATYGSHEGAITYSLPIDTLMHDIQRIVERVKDLADQFIADTKQRSDIKASAEKYLVHCIILIMINLGRRRDAGLKQLVPVIWQCRRDLMKAGFLKSAILLVRPLALATLPKPITDWIRITKRKIVADFSRDIKMFQGALRRKL